MPTGWQRAADALTLSRAVVAIPLLLALEQQWSWAAWWLWVLAAATDAGDGWLARRNGGGSAWGARFDPLCDKLLVLASLLWLGARDTVPLWAVWLLLAREFLVTSWREQQSNGAPAGQTAKLKTISQFLAVGCLLWPGPGQHFSVVTGQITFWLAMVLAMISGWQYLVPGTAVNS